MAETLEYSTVSTEVHDSGPTLLQHKLYLHMHNLYGKANMFGHSKLKIFVLSTLHTHYLLFSYFIVHCRCLH